MLFDIQVLIQHSQMVDIKVLNQEAQRANSSDKVLWATPIFCVFWPFISGTREWKSSQTTMGNQGLYNWMSVIWNPSLPQFKVKFYDF